MRKITIIRQDTFLGTSEDVKVISNSMFVGVFKKEEKQFEFEVGKSQQAIQIEFSNELNQTFRSNCYFVMYGKENVTIHFSMSGSSLILALKTKGEEDGTRK